jgi:uracil-DNA glycosylase
VSLADLMAPDWAAAMEPMAERIASMGDYLREENAAGRGYLPAGHDVFRAFAYPLADVRVLIVGQDPYPTPGHPIGLSFAVAPTVRPLPGSLVNIFKELIADLGGPPPSTGDLRPWAEHGVMLLNRVLTVQPGRPAAHRGKGWEAVTGHAIDALVARRTPLVAILWGRDAQSLQPALTSGGAQCLTSPHPSPLSASRGFFGSRPFSRANALLAAAGARPVDWRLP